MDFDVEENIPLKSVDRVDSVEKKVELTKFFLLAFIAINVIRVLVGVNFSFNCVCNSLFKFR